MINEMRLYYNPTPMRLSAIYYPLMIVNLTLIGMVCIELERIVLIHRG